MQFEFDAWFTSSGTPVSSTNKTDRHDIAEILLNVVLDTIHQLDNPTFSTLKTLLVNEFCLKFTFQVCNIKPCGYDVGDCGTNDYDKLIGYSLEKKTSHYDIPKGIWLYLGCLDGCAL